MRFDFRPTTFSFFHLPIVLTSCVFFYQTVLILTPDTLNVLTSSKKRKAFESLGSSREIEGTTLKLNWIERGRNAEAYAKNYEQVLGLLKESGGTEGAVVGRPIKEKQKGKFSSGLLAKLTESKEVAFGDASLGLGIELACKDSKAVSAIKKAAFFSTQVLRKFLLRKIEEIIDEESKVSHADIADSTDEVFDDGSFDFRSLQTLTSY